MFVLGTAGHIDHGKSVLVRALTGIDPDRLREEKERGMTIDLGFAWLKLPDGREVGIVDVPGHERLIKNMLAGVGGIDLALLIVDASEGVMPQTKEHLAILDLLGIEKGIVVLTKMDLVGHEEIELVVEEVTELITPTILSGAPIVAVSALSGEGMPELVSAISSILESIPQKKNINRPRLPIDRVFTVAGSGTVVTGTLVDGALRVGQEIEIVPAGLKSRVRALQTHKASVDVAEPGTRVGINIVGLAASDLQRGDVVTSPGWLSPTSMVSVKLSTLPYLRRPLRHGTTFNFYAGSSQSSAKLRLLENDELNPGETGWAQVSLGKSLALVRGDRFIIRSPEVTLGGGEVFETHARRYRRHQKTVISNLSRGEKGSTSEVIQGILETYGSMDVKGLLKQSNLPVEQLGTALDDLIEEGKIIGIGEVKSRLLFTQKAWNHLADQVRSIVGDYHSRYPLRLGMPEAELSSRLKMGTNRIEIIKRLIGEGDLIGEGSALRLPEHRVSLTETQRIKIDDFLKSLEEKPFAPPSDLIPEPDLVAFLTGRKQVVKVAEDVIFSYRAYNEMLNRVISYLKQKGSISVAEVRDMFKTSRKYALSFMEYLDGIKLTRRIGDRRVLYRESAAKHD